MVKYWTSSGQELFGARARKRALLILSARIFDSSVERGIPSRAAAPDGPNTRPPLARRASSTIDFSCAANVPDRPSRLSTAAAPGEPALVDREFVGVGHDHRPLDHVLQLANIPRPGIGPAGGRASAC